MRRRIGLLLALAALAGCGGEESRQDPPAAEPTFTDPRGDADRPTGQVSVSARPGGAPKFEQASLEAAAGEVTFELTNPSTTTHSLCIESDELGTLGCTALFRSDRGTLRVQLEPGEYTFFCSAPGHREAGMAGALTVR